MARRMPSVGDDFESSHSGIFSRRVQYTHTTRVVGGIPGWLGVRGAGPGTTGPSDQLQRTNLRRCTARTPVGFPGGQARGTGDRPVGDNLHLFCTQGVTGSNPVGRTSFIAFFVIAVSQETHLPTPRTPLRIRRGIRGLGFGASEHPPFGGKCSPRTGPPRRSRC